MESLPNIHLLGLFIVSITVVFRAKALYPIYIYVLLDGVRGGFSGWWLADLYIWAILWAAAMLLPTGPSKRRFPEWLKKKLPQRLSYMLVAGLHGLAFGTLYAPVWALLGHLDLRGTLSWIAAGLAFDAIHGLSNFLACLFAPQLIAVLRKADKL
ncbi:MAG: hypothetical protein LBQ33_06655 [Oscillospiraceae bacterium]|nr:hypothetical protein [Oscillospiraceae bacterium]